MRHMLLMGAAVAGLIGIGWCAGVRLNTTASIQRGLWFVHPREEAFERGQVVAACLPDSPAVAQARERNWIGPGFCDNGLQPVLKTVVALPGDTVEVAIVGNLFINRLMLPNSEPMATDSKGVPLIRVMPGRYVVQPGEVWLINGYSARSFDSRYFGPVPQTAIAGVATPMVTE
jgi:conjugative transfer signal peptidase TraF